MELKPDLLRDVAIFGGLNDETLKALLSRASRIEVARGDHFMREGEMGTSFFVLERGKVSVTKASGDATIHLCDFEPGAVFGEMSLLAVRPRSASIRSVEDCIALEFTNSSLFDLYEAEPGQFAMLVMNLGREVARRLWETNQRLFEATCGD